MKMSTFFKNAAEKFDQLLSVMFLTIFLVQFGFLLFGYIQPSELNTVTKVVKQDLLEEFPLLFQFCLRPGLDMTVLKNNGFTNMDNYFYGVNGSNEWDTDIGWGGENSSLTPEGLSFRIPQNLAIFFPLRIAESEPFGEAPFKIHLGYLGYHNNRVYSRAK